MNWTPAQDIEKNKPDRGELIVVDTPGGFELCQYLNDKFYPKGKHEAIDPGRVIRYVRLRK